MSQRRSHHPSRPNHRDQTRPAHSRSENFIYGRNPVHEAIVAGRRKIIEVLATREALEELEIASNREREFQLKTVTRHELDRLVPEAPHQGVVARVGAYPYVDLGDILQSADDRSLVLVLDGVQDPQNLGALCRTAKAFGAAGVVIAQDNAVEVTAVVCKASAGAVESLPIAKVVNVARALESAKKAGYWVYGASLADDSVALPKLDPAQKSVLVLGAEGRGLRRLVEETCDVRVSIPMPGGFESLNVSQAGAIFCYVMTNKI